MFRHALKKLLVHVSCTEGGTVTNNCIGIWPNHLRDRQLLHNHLILLLQRVTLLYFPFNLPSIAGCEMLLRFTLPFSERGNVSPKLNCLGE